MSTNNSIFKTAVEKWKEITKIKNNDEYAKALSDLFDFLNVYNLKENEPVIIAYESVLSIDKINKVSRHYQLEELSDIYHLYYFIDSSNWFEYVKYENIHIFYPQDNIIDEFETLNKDDKFLVAGYKKTSNSKFSKIISESGIADYEICEDSDEVLKILDKYDENHKKYVFSLKEDKYESIVKQMTYNYICNNITNERNVFVKGENNLLKKKKHFEGDIIITDPCYIIRHRDESTRPKWKDYHQFDNINKYPDYDVNEKTSPIFMEEAKKLDEADKKWCKENPDDHDSWNNYDLSQFGITTFIAHRTLYGDWSCTTFNTDTKETLGEFCADGGEVGVFLLDEVLKYNPDFNDYIDNPWTTTLIKNFKGDVWFEQLDEDTLIVKGEGNCNFFTSQTGF